MTKISALAPLSTPQGQDLVAVVDTSDTFQATSGTTKKVALADLFGLLGLQYLTGSGALGSTAGTVNTTTISNAIAGGFTGIYLDPRYKWTFGTLDITGVSNFTIESRMGGSIGWTGAVLYNTGGYCDTGSGPDGLRIYGDVGSETQGITLRGLALVGSNSNAVLHLGGRQRAVKVENCFAYNTNGSSTTVAAGSNGVAVSTFTGTQTLNVASAAAFASAGNALVPTTGSNGIALVSYTGKSGTTLTGCTLLAGGGTLATGATVYQAAFAVVVDTAIKDFNSEDQRFRGLQAAGVNCAVGWGINDLTQHHNDSAYYDLVTACSAGPVSVVARVSSNLQLHMAYDRSPATGATVATYWNDGGQPLNFWGGEDQNNSSTGVSHLLSGGNTTVNNRLLTQGGGTGTVFVQAGSYYVRGRSKLNGTLTVNSGAVLDASDPACNVGSATVTGAGKAFLNANPVAGGPTTLSSWTGSDMYAPGVVATKSGTGQTTAQSLTWTPPAANCMFRVSVMVHLTATVTGVVSVGITFTERGSTARSYNIPLLRQDGVATAPVFNAGAVDTYLGQVCSQTDNSATSVVVTATPTASTPYRYAITIECLALA